MSVFFVNCTFYCSKKVIIKIQGRTAGTAYAKSPFMERRVTRVRNEGENLLIPESGEAQGNARTVGRGSQNWLILYYLLIIFIIINYY